MTILGVGKVIYEKTDKSLAFYYVVPTEPHQPCASNVADILSTLKFWDQESRIFTAIGQDRPGEILLESLMERGIDVSQIARTQDSAVDHIQTDGVTRTSNGTSPLYDNLSANYGAAFEGVTLAYLEGTFGKIDVETYAQCVSRNIPYVIAANDARNQINWLFGGAHSVISTPKFHRDCYGNMDYKENLQRILDGGAKNAIVKIGTEKVLAKTGDQTFEVPIINQAIDSEGAGEAFAAAYLYAVLQECDLEESLRVAASVTAKCCEQVGAQRGLPNLEEMGEIVRQL